MDEPEGSCPVCHEGEGDGERRSHHDERTIRELVNRMNRIEGQVRGIRGMIERHVYCDDVLNQIASAQAALHGVAKLLLEKHMKSCVKEQLRSGDDEVVDEVLKTIFRLIK
ncbi:Metal-sensitive transcriptional repressor [Acididesulfobacillus acetoxydans]|uniref:Metal-sensitive transcriptional repressor n=1 Tax=Acididesulfobacillus acetoxydans TaxID=1561005 RepID=A0A8S0WM96_9FIRM|nr:metal-sensitive transcriptional regulator [Acididesulfobacillus acetoxydans]CAA7600474.1 Metal-sensitive transcriptional repressor [Acididesulfobacillus acetoxydans]CEJ06608.1 Metal-sensitive transcriptional repressor [Acididesulfobacillus acetoxydans]